MSDYVAAGLSNHLKEEILQFVYLILLSDYKVVGLLRVGLLSHDCISILTDLSLLTI